MRLIDHVALVSGMAMGIGEGIAELFAAEGAAVIGVDIDDKGGSATAERIRSKGGHCLFCLTDVALEKAVQAAVEAGLKEFGRIDILVNNAGIQSQAPAHQMELAEWERILRVNLTSMFLTSKYVLPSMLGQKRGSIVNISSAQALIGFAGYPHYAASKGGIVSLTRQMSREYASHGIRVNCILPGTVEIARGLQAWARSPIPNLRAAFESMYPIGRLGKPIDIAYGALYLASGESSWVTGQCLVIDGGLTTSAPLAPTPPLD